MAGLDFFTKRGDGNVKFCDPSLATFNLYQARHTHTHTHTRAHKHTGRERHTQREHKKPSYTAELFFPHYTKERREVMLST